MIKKAAPNIRGGFFYLDFEEKQTAYAPFYRSLTQTYRSLNTICKIGVE